MKPLAFQVGSFDITKYSDNELWARMTAFSRLYSGMEEDFRLLAYSRPYPLEGAVENLRHLMAGTSDPLTRERLAAYRRFIEELVETSSLKTTNYYVLVFSEKAPRIKLKTENISSTGALISADLPLAVGTTLEIDIDIPLEALRALKGDKAKVALKGEVVRISGRGTALAFGKDCQLNDLPLMFKNRKGRGIENGLISYVFKSVGFPRLDHEAGLGSPGFG